MKAVHRFKTHKGDTYAVVFKPRIRYKGKECIGLCDPPDDEEAVIKIAEKQNRLQLLQTVVHEMAHAFFWDASETNVDRFAKSTVTLLKKLKLI